MLKITRGVHRGTEDERSEKCTWTFSSGELTIKERAKIQPADKCSKRDEEEGMQVQNEVRGLLPVAYGCFGVH